MPYIRIGKLPEYLSLLALRLRNPDETPHESR